MSQRRGLKIETCVYPWIATSAGVSMLLGRQRSDFNAGLWVPLGRQVDESSYPLRVASDDLLTRRIPTSTLRPAGIVTEIGVNNWQTHLFLFVSPLDEPIDIPPDEFAEEYRWVTPDQAQELDRPKSDAMFDYSFLRSDGGFYYAEFLFDAQERATRQASEVYH